MLCLPPDTLLQSDAAVANEPQGSGNTYQLSVTGPLPEDPQPTTSWRAEYPCSTKRGGRAPGCDLDG
jgi:hypothetical protein